jgi:hypothetical protein
MDEVYGCAPLYFIASIPSLILAGLLIYYDHPIIGSFLAIPAGILLVLALIAMAMTVKLKKQIRHVTQIVSDSKPNLQTQTKRKKKRRNRR